jgi:hypothetical protein
VVLKDLLSKCTDSDLNVVSCLNDVNTIVHIIVPLLFDGYREPVLNEVHHKIGGVTIRSQNSKVINYVQE